MDSKGSAGSFDVVEIKDDRPTSLISRDSCTIDTLDQLVECAGPTRLLAACCACTICKYVMEATGVRVDHLRAKTSSQPLMIRKGEESDRSHSRVNERTEQEEKATRR